MKNFFTVLVGIFLMWAGMKLLGSTGTDWVMTVFPWILSAAGFVVLVIGIKGALQDHRKK
ncbi:MAG: hypothetical protein ACOYB8_08345 [Eubacteriaceae bacterium]